jgi:hypothetical protein
MDTEICAAASTVTAEILALERAGVRCSIVERHVERPSGKFLHLEAVVQCRRMRLPVDTIVLRGCLEETHWLLLRQQLEYLRTRFAAKI